MALPTASPIEENDFAVPHDEWELENSSHNPVPEARSDLEDSPAYSLKEPLTDAAGMNPRLELLEEEDGDEETDGLPTRFTPSTGRYKGGPSDVRRRTIGVLTATTVALLPIFIVLLLGRLRKPSWRKELRENGAPYNIDEFVNSVQRAVDAVRAQRGGEPSSLRPVYHEYHPSTADSTLRSTEALQGLSGLAGVEILLKESVKHLRQRWKEETSFPKFHEDPTYLRLLSYYTIRANEFRQLAAAADDVYKDLVSNELATGIRVEANLGDGQHLNRLHIKAASKVATDIADALTTLIHALQDEYELQSMQQVFSPPVLKERRGEDVHQVLRDWAGVELKLQRAVLRWRHAAPNLPMWLSDAFSRTFFMEPFSMMTFPPNEAARLRQLELTIAANILNGLAEPDPSLLSWTFAKPSATEPSSLAFRRFVTEAALFLQSAHFLNEPNADYIETNTQVADAARAIARRKHFLLGLLDEIPPPEASTISSASPATNQLSETVPSEPLPPEVPSQEQETPLSSRLIHAGTVRIRYGDLHSLKALLRAQVYVAEEVSKAADNNELPHSSPGTSLFAQYIAHLGLGATLLQVESEIATLLGALPPFLTKALMAGLPFETNTPSG